MLFMTNNERDIRFHAEMYRASSALDRLVCMTQDCERRWEVSWWLRACHSADLWRPYNHSWKL